MINANRRAGLFVILLFVLVTQNAYGAPPPCQLNGQTCSLDVCSAATANLTCDAPAKICHAFCGLAGQPNQEVPPVVQNTLSGLRSNTLASGTEVSAVAEMVRVLKREIDAGRIRATPPSGAGFITFFVSENRLRFVGFEAYKEGRGQPPIVLKDNMIIVMYNISERDLMLLKGMKDENIMNIVQTAAKSIDFGK
jgi:hypothetical protein